MGEEAKNLEMVEGKKFENFWNLTQYTLLKIFSAGVADKEKVAKIKLIVDELIAPKDAHAALKKIKVADIALTTRAMRHVKYNIRCAKHTNPPLCNKFQFASGVLNYLMALKRLTEVSQSESSEDTKVDFGNEKKLKHFQNLCREARNEFEGMKNLLTKILLKVFIAGDESPQELQSITRELQVVVVYGLQEFFCALSPAVIEKIISGLQKLQNFLSENVFAETDLVLDSAAWKVSQIMLSYLIKLEAALSFEDFIMRQGNK